MPAKNKRKAAKTMIEFQATPRVMLELKKLLKKGFYGNTIGAVAERIICQGLINMQCNKTPHNRVK